jgi:hypothetical protein
MKIISVITNNPFFIELQEQSFRKYVHVPYEYIVFNDGKDFKDSTNNGLPIKTIIRETCRARNICCIELDNDHHQTYTSPSDRHVDSLKHMLEYMKTHEDEYLMIDGDMFLIHDLPIDTYRKYHCACVMQYRQINYIWPNLFYMDMRKIQNKEILSFGFHQEGDTGSASSIWLNTYTEDVFPPSGESIRYTDRSYTSDHFYFIKHLWSCSWNHTEIPECLSQNISLREILDQDIRNKEDGSYFAEIYDNCFFHYRAGTWFMLENPELQSEQIHSLAKILDLNSV